MIFLNEYLTQLDYWRQTHATTYMKEGGVHFIVFAPGRQKAYAHNAVEAVRPLNQEARR